MQISAIKIDPNANHVEVSLSAKALELEVAKRRQREGLIREGMTSLGTFTSIRQSTKKVGHIGIHAYLDAFKMPAIVKALDPRTLSVTPKAGDKVRLDVLDLSDGGRALAS